MYCGSTVPLTGRHKTTVPILSVPTSVSTNGSTHQVLAATERLSGLDTSLFEAKGCVYVCVCQRECDKEQAERLTTEFRQTSIHSVPIPTGL